MYTLTGIKIRNLIIKIYKYLLKIQNLTHIWGHWGVYCRCLIKIVYSSHDRTSYLTLVYNFTCPDNIKKNFILISEVSCPLKLQTFSMKSLEDFIGGLASKIDHEHDNTAKL